MPAKYANKTDMTSEEKVQAAFNDSVGVILTYLDEAKVGSAIKRSVKTELYELCDDEMKVLVSNLEGQGKGCKDETSYNQ